MAGGTEYRRGRGPHFAPIPFELLDDPEADALTIAAYAAIKSYADFGSTGGAKVSDPTAAKRAGMSPRSFRDRRDRLRRMGWLDWEEDPGRCNRYTVHNSPPVTPAGGAGVPRQEVPDPPAGGADDREPVTESQIPRTPPTPPKGGSQVGPPDGFAEFWEQYPARTGSNPRREAERAWRARMKEGVDPDEIMVGLDRYVTYLEATGRVGTEFVQQAATFLGGRKRSWEEPWTIPAANGNGASRADQRILEHRMQLENVDLRGGRSIFDGD